MPHPGPGRREFFAQSGGTLQDFARDPRWLGAQLGFLGVLHTWGQTLVFHPHIHYIVPQGGIDAEGRWVSPRLKDQARFLFPIQAVSEVFRGRFLQHVAPKGFRRIRHYGFLANGAGREAVRQVQEQWLSRVLILLAMVGRLGPLLEEGSGAEPDPGDWTPVCPFCGQGPLRYLPKRLEWVRPDDTS